ncbi:MAG TPA: hypothetical protein PLD84_12480 [Chitinophagales bacterium]|nr:hypothetical protein [Chitinophagales bacterium]
MKKFLLFSAPALAVLAFPMIYLSGCTFDKSFPDTSNGNNLVCFETEVLPVIQSNCAKAGCHDPITKEKGYDFSSYNGIMEAVKPGQPNSSKLYEVLNENGEDQMPPPPNPPLSADQKNTIKMWIEEGASNGPCTAVICDTASITYSGTVAPILQTYCLGCHSVTSTGGGILLNNYNNVYDQKDVIMDAITWTGSVVPMPLNGAQLDDCSISAIDSWIKAGAPNN